MCLLIIFCIIFIEEFANATADRNYISNPKFESLELNTLNKWLFECLREYRNLSSLVEYCNAYYDTDFFRINGIDECDFLLSSEAWEEMHRESVSNGESKAAPGLILKRAQQLNKLVHTFTYKTASDYYDIVLSQCDMMISAMDKGIFDGNVIRINELDGPFRENKVNIKGMKFHISQLEYLIEKAMLNELQVDMYSSRSELQSTENLLEYLRRAQINAVTILSQMLELPQLKEDEESLLLLGQYYSFNRYIYIRPYTSLSSLATVLSPTRRVWEWPNSTSSSNPSMLTIEERYNKDQVVVIDDFLQEAVIQELYEWCMESTVWHAKYYRRYVGSMWDDGFHHPLLLRIAHEMRNSFSFLHNLSLVQMWAFNYHPAEHAGIALHADSAIVNINLWITPDDPNMDPDAGGLIIFTKPLLGNESFEEMQIPSFGYEYIKGTEHMNRTVTYKRNRVTVFNSNLYHETGSLRFKPGYKNRRINFTFLFGVSPQWALRGNNYV